MRGERVGGAEGRCDFWSKYPVPAEGPGVGGGREGSARWERPPSSKEEETEGVNEGAEELPLLMEAGVGGSVSSDRKLALLIAGLGIGGPVLDIGWAPSGGG